MFFFGKTNKKKKQNIDDETLGMIIIPNEFYGGKDPQVHFKTTPNKHSRNKKKRSAPNGITFGMMSVILMIVSIVLILTMVKIYLSNQIYYESKKVNKIQREVEALKAENMILKQNVEALKFKNRVTDTIFVINDAEQE